MFRILTSAVMLLVVLSGCFGNRPKNTIEGTTINLPPNETINSDEVANKVNDRISATTHNTQDTMQGLLNNSISNIEALKGIDAKLSSYIEMNTKITNSLQSTIEMHNELRANLNSIIKMNNRIQTELKAVTSINAKLDVYSKINSNIQADIKAGLVNLSTQVDNTYKASAGHDVNFLPQNAVDLLLHNLYVGIAIILLLAIVATIVIILSFKASREREAARTVQEREERQALIGILTETLTHVSSEHAHKVRELLQEKLCR